MPHVAVLQSSLRNHVTPMWALERVPGEAGGDMLRLGERRVRLDDIAGFAAHADATSYRHGRLLAGLLFAAFAAYTLIDIIALNGQWRYMLSVAILTALSLMCLQDVYLSTESRMYRFRIVTRGGEQIAFALAEDASAAALLAVLNSAVPAR